MNDHPVLGRVLLGYMPMIDANRAIVATRVAVFPARPDIEIDAPALLAALAEAWPADAPPVVLAPAGEDLLRDMLADNLPAPMGLEVPAFMATDAAVMPLLQAQHRRGTRLLLKGRALAELPRELQPCFAHAVVDAESVGTAALPPGTVVSGIRTRSVMQAAFDRKAARVFGWPIDDPVPPSTGKNNTASDFQAIVELIRRVDAQEPIDRLEAVLKLDPTLAFKLMRYINSPAFGLTVEISSFGHALMLLGYQRLKRWLALLLVSAGKDREMKPLMHGAVRRGLLMEELARGTGDDQMRGEAFICGVFSLLDVMLSQPFADLLKTLPVPASVHQALAEGTGPFAPTLAVARAVEQESPFDLREAASQSMLTEGEINRALLLSLQAARQLD